MADIVMRHPSLQGHASSTPLVLFWLLRPENRLVIDRQLSCVLCLENAVERSSSYEDVAVVVGPGSVDDTIVLGVSDCIRSAEGRKSAENVVDHRKDQDRLRREMGEGRGDVIVEA